MTMRLIAIDGAVIRAVRDGAAEPVTGASVGPCAQLVADVVQQTEAMLLRAPRDPMFGGYLAVDEEGRIIGTCGFRKGPSAGGEVEIAYFTFPQYVGRGHATEMASRLVRLAKTSASVRLVIAHTVPESNASTRVLEKVGMKLIGPVEDAEDGIVWRWES